VWLDVVIGKDGHVASVQSISGDPVLVGNRRTSILRYSRLRWAGLISCADGQPASEAHKLSGAYARYHLVWFR